MKETGTSKESVLARVFSNIRAKGYVPIVNNELSSVGNIQVDEVCVHGKSDSSQYVSFYGDSDEDLDLDPPPEDRGWENESEGFGGGEGCSICEGKLEVVCPSCDAPFPRPTEEETKHAYLLEEDLLCTKKCSSCGSSFLVWGGDGQRPLFTPKSIGPEVCGQWGFIKKEPAKSTNRNSPCPCGSGKKYKKCCLD